MVLAWTLKVTVPLPVPEVGAAKLIQGTGLAVDQAQPAAAEADTVPTEAENGKAAEVLESEEVPQAMVNGKDAVAIPPVVTAMAAEPLLAIRVAVTGAVSWVVDTNVVGRAVEFQVTEEAVVKPVPVRARAKEGPPAVAVLGETAVKVRAAWLTVKGRPAMVRSAERAVPVSLAWTLKVMVALPVPETGAAKVIQETGLEVDQAQPAGVERETVPTEAERGKVAELGKSE